MNDQQPEAIMLASQLDAVPETGADPAELRRLHAENERLLAEVDRLTLYASGADMLVGVWKERAKDFMSSCDRLRAEMEAIGAGGVGPLMKRKPSAEGVIQMTKYASALGNIDSPFNKMVTSDEIDYVHELRRHSRKLGEPVGETAGVMQRAADEIERLRAMIAAAPQPQGEQAPVAWTVAGQVQNWARDFSAYRTKHYVRPVYPHPQPRRQPLTNAEIYRLEVLPHMTVTEVVRIVERAHDIGQEGSAA